MIHDELRVALSLYVLGGCFAQRQVTTGIEVSDDDPANVTDGGPRTRVSRDELAKPQQMSGLTMAEGIVGPRIVEYNDDFIDSPTAGRIWAMGRLALWALQRPALSECVKGRHLLELGSGTGIAGISAAWAGAASVILTDRLAGIDLLERNVAANSRGTAAATASVGVNKIALGGAEVGTMTVRELNWLHDTSDVAALGHFCTLFGSDVFYNEEVQDAFLKKVLELWPHCASPCSSQQPAAVESSSAAPSTIVSVPWGAPRCSRQSRIAEASGNKLFGSDDSDGGRQRRRQRRQQQ